MYGSTSFRLFALWLCCLLFPCIVSAQETPPPPAQSANNQRAVRTMTVSGTVKDEAGAPLPGASVLVKGTRTSVLTNIDGKFELKDISSTATLEVSFLGFETYELAVNGRANVEVMLIEEAARLDDVVVIGNMERKKESFTGAASIVSGSALKQMGSANVVESLKSIDPSFVVLENTLAGANPNALPTIEVRGQTAINISEVNDLFGSDPNAPLFILDGFESTLQKIVDLDFNRVASVTLLKDAASTAFYGSRAANGVLMVETVRPEVGRFKFFYNGDYSVQTPDLSSYNMMNATEKLEFERLSGRYTFEDLSTSTDYEYQVGLDRLYSQRLAEVLRGVDTYWMSEPLRTAFINRQSVRVSGGSEEISVDAGVSFKNAPGVMKGSKRQTWTGDLDFTYNKGNLSITNRLGLSGYTATESPYGSFSGWVETNPYYRKTDENGDAQQWLDIVKPNNVYISYPERWHYVANPLYNARLNSKNETTNIDINERLLARWKFYKGMQLQGMFQLISSNSNTVRFTPPEHTSYYLETSDKKGEYYDQDQRKFSYVANLMYTWNNTIGKHSYVVNARGEVAHENKKLVHWSATGFPIGTNGVPSFAGGFRQDSRPGYANSVYRRANFLVSGNYSYNNRYLFDATFRYDGSTVFGSAKKFTPFWSTGIGWNLHEESFIKNNAHWLTQLRLRATVGQTGNQNLGSITSSSVYAYVANSNIFGAGTSLNQFGNPNIEWQKTTTTNLAMDLNLFNSFFVGKFDVYQKYTNPLVVPVDQAPSAGQTQYVMNLGNLTVRGFEFEGTFAAIRNTAQGISWRIKLMGSINKSEYGGFQGKIEGTNTTNQNSDNLSTALTRYRDGYSPNTLWAVPSLGIDPATGQEMFLTRYGLPTFVYDPADIVAVGLKEPDVYGTISSFFTWKQLTLSVVLRYSLGAQMFNEALFEKVENISFNELAYNQDKRALYERWQKAGDMAEFKGISYTTTTNKSSRFIQKENYLSGESIGLMWRFDKSTWIRHLGLSSLDFNATATGNYGIFRLSNIQRERGINYPEAYTINLSVSAVF